MVKKKMRFRVAFWANLPPFPWGKNDLFFRQKRLWKTEMSLSKLY